MAEHFQSDPDSPGWVKAWGVYRMAPWHFVGPFQSEQEAKAICAEKGDQYKVGFGSHKPGTDDFVMTSSR